MESKKTVLLIGARGFLGSKVLDAVLAKNKASPSYTIKALIRGGSNASRIEAKNVEVVRGDMMDPPSLEAACKDVDVVILTANGYMQGHPEIDKVGLRNVVDALKKCQVKRCVFCSVLTADLAKDVEHFYVKYEIEEYMKEKEVPYVALRPGAFIDQGDDYLGDGIKRGDSFALSVWDKTVPIGMIYTPDLAKFFADSIDLPEDANNKSIDLGWSRPITYQEVVSICATKLDRKISCVALPGLLRHSVIYTIGFFSSYVKELMLMFNYFGRGTYINNTENQTKYFGEAPTPEDVIGRYVDKIMAEKASSSASQSAAAS